LTLRLWRIARNDNKGKESFLGFLSIGGLPGMTNYELFNCELGEIYIKLVLVLVYNYYSLIAGYWSLIV